MNAAETKQLASELESSGFAKAVIDQALQKVPKHLKPARAAEWCFDWILSNPQGEKAGAAGGAGDGKAGGAAKPNGSGAGAGAGGGGAMVDDGDPLAEIIAMGFSRDAARIALEEQGDVGAAINALLQDAERIEAEAAKQREAKRAADEKAAKEAKAKAAELQRAARLKVLHSNIYRTVCAYRFRKADPTKEDTDRVQAIFALSTLYEPVEEELNDKKKNPPAPAPTAAAAAAAGAGRGKPVAGKPAAAAGAAAAAAAAAMAGKAGGKDAKSNGAVVGPLKSVDCTVCRSDWDSDTKPVTFTNCGHSVICTGCLSKYVAIKVRDKDVLPWIPCSAADCKVPLHPKDVINQSAITTPELYALLSTYCAKMLARESQWVECATKGCGYGFWLEAKEVKEMEAKNSAKKGTGFKTEKCVVCSTSQKVSPKTEELDNEFKKMIAEGKLRPCPKCTLMTMKEYGVCNVLECAKCGIWWNWRSRETGRTSKELKDRARMKGTLWEAGELEFQQRLERTNHAEFVKLLERNGVKYDPNYHRGT